MEKKKYRCKVCGNVFETTIIRNEEAKERRIQLVPIVCPRCQKPHIEEIRN